MALSIDQFANVSLKTPLNFLMIKEGHRIYTKLEEDNLDPVCYYFGDEDDTISYCIAMNQKYDALTKFGKFWAWFLDWVDFNAKKKGSTHLKETLRMKDLRDHEACRRLRNKQINLN